MSFTLQDILEKGALLIDGSSFIYRAYYAIPGYLATSKGFPTKAIFGITQMLLKILKEGNPKIIVWFMDEKGPTFRHLKYEEYKATRPGMPEDLKIQIPYIKKIVSALGIPLVSAEGYEADDLIATFIKTFDIPVLMIAPDKDLFSLISERVLAYDPIRENLIDLNTFQKKYGFSPQSFCHFRALTGDPSDNIKGVPGIGEKTAQTLIQTFHTLENLYENISRVTPLKLRESLLKYKEQVFQNFDLMKLRIDAPLPSQDLSYYYRKEPNYRELKRLFKELEFRKFLKEFSFPEEIPTFQTIEISPSELKELILRENPTTFALFPEKISTGLFNLKDITLLISFTPEKCYLTKFDSALWNTFTNKEVIVYDYKALLHLIERNLEDPFDVKLASYLLNPTLKNYEFSQLVFEHLDYTLNEKTSDKGLKGISLLLLGRELKEKLTEEGLFHWLKKVEMPLSRVLYYMEKKGIKIDLEYVRNLIREYDQKIKEIENKLFDLVGTRFNPRSSQEVAKILFEKLKLPKIKKTQKSSQPSTDAEVLEELYDHHPIVPLILRYRTLYKFKSTYLEVFLREVSSIDKRLHTEFNQTGTATGRLSSQKPNLQNIPVKGEEGLAIRRAFIAEEGCYILSLDYSQIELRILAHFSGDENLISAFERDFDIHTHTACEVFGVPPDKVTSEMRRVAKVINFGIAYGMSPYGLSKELRIDPSSAEAYIKKYFSRYPKVKEYIEKTIEFAKAQGYVQTLSGRKRFIPELFSQTKSIRELGYRIAVNTPIQGSAADLMKAAMVALFSLLERENLKSSILLQVHDELLLEVPENELEQVISLAQEIMINPFSHLGLDLCLSVPLKVNVSYGKSWADCKA
ncbi:MAG: DNA polymerase I [Caldimicrobium sp.]